MIARPAEGARREPIDTRFAAAVHALASVERAEDATPHHWRAGLDAYFHAQLLSRHVDFALRWLQQRGEGYYTITSAGHEADAAVALALRPTDPALLHYRSGAFYLARAGQVGDADTDAITHILAGAIASTEDPISHGRHKVIGSARLNIIPQTSTIASHLPRAVGLAYALANGAARDSRYPPDAVVVCSFGDASVNHSTAAGALNAASYIHFRKIPLPIIFVCEDNGLGISVPTPTGWIEQALRSRPGLRYVAADGASPLDLLQQAQQMVDDVRRERSPAILHLKTVRLMGHAGSDVESAYRNSVEIISDYERDPLLSTARLLVHRGLLEPEAVLESYEDARRTVMEQAARLVAEPVPRLSSGASVRAPLELPRPSSLAAERARHADHGHRRRAFGGELPEDRGGQTLARALNATLFDTLAARPQTLVFGEDVARKGGIYGITRGLHKRFGGARVFDTLLDEQTILGLALGAALQGFLPITEIQYLAYLHNAEDQLRGEAASLAFFSAGQYTNGMVVRIAGLAYQRGLGGHFHNDNSVATLRDIPGLVVAVPSLPGTAPYLFRECIALAATRGTVCVFLEPIALYHERDLNIPGDERWLGRYAPPSEWSPSPAELGSVRTIRAGSDVCLVTFGNGVRMSLRAAEQLATNRSLSCRVIDLQWVAPLPVDDLRSQLQHVPVVLVVDETRRSGGVADAIIAALVRSGFSGRISSLSSEDSFVPLGPADRQVLVTEEKIVTSVQKLVEG